MELSDSESSESLDFLMQQLSTQKYRKPSLAVCSPQNLIFSYPALPWPEPSTISSKVTSWLSSPHVCERMAYRGIALSSNFPVRRKSPFDRSSKRRIVARGPRGRGGTSVEDGSCSTATTTSRGAKVVFVLRST